MDKKKFGIFTPYSVNLYSECNTDNPANFLKRNAILFDKLVIVPLGIGHLDGTGFFTKFSYLNAYSKENVKYKKELTDLLLTIDDFVEEDNRQDFYMPRNPETSMWCGENSDNYIDFVKKYVQKKEGLDSPEIQSREHMQVLKHYIGDISADFQVLTESMRRFDSFSGLFSEIHEQAFTATYNQKESKTQNKHVISSIESLNHFDFGSLSWDEIITLRKSEFINDFREKVSVWSQEFNKSCDHQEFQTKLDNYIDDSKFDFIERQKPNIIKTTLTGIAGNIPLPIPINPVSVISTIAQIANEKRIKNDFGWLFFIQKARKNCST